MYILDTNFIYYISDDNKVSEEQLNNIRRKADHRKIKFGIPPVSVIEILSRLYEEPSLFEKIKKSCEIVLSFKPKSIPDPNEMMIRILKNEILELVNGTINWNHYLKTITLAKDFSELNGKIVALGSGVSREIKLEMISDFRQEYETDYIKEMVSLAKRFNPDFDRQSLLEKPTKLSSTEQVALNTFLNTTDWTSEIRNLVSTRAKRVLPRDLSTIDSRIKYFRLGYEYLIKKMFCNGAYPNLKKKNDYNDLHQLIYVNDQTRDQIISDDKGVLQTIGKSSGKVISLSDFLSAETV